MTRFVDICLLGVENTYNTEQTTLTPMLTTSDIQLDMDSEPRVQRDVARNLPGAMETMDSGWGRATLNLSTEFNAASTPGEAPPWAALALGGAMAGTLDATNGTAVYNPILDDEKSLTAHVHKGTNIYKLTGLRGGLNFDMPLGGMPSLSWSGMGFRAGYGTGAPPGTTVEAGNPRSLRKGETTAQFGPHTLCVISASGSMNSVVGLTNSTCDKVIVGDHQPSLQVVCEAPSLDVINWFLQAENDYRGAFALTWGEAGNKNRIAAPKGAIGKVAMSKGNNIHQLTIDIACLPDTGYDAILLETGNLS